MDQFNYENLHDVEFEELVIRISKEILGIGCKTFSIGKDGGKDSFFSGKALCFPSPALPWEGDFVIQAKHTKTVNASCSDNDFSVNQSCILNKEIARLKTMIQEAPFDHYIIFTNRKLTGTSHSDIVKMLQDGLGFQTVEIVGREQLNTYLTDYPHVAAQFGLHYFAYPLRFYEKDIRDVIIVFSTNRKNIALAAQNYITSLDLISKEEKNVINNLSSDYFEFLKKGSLQYFEEINHFLKNPANEKYMNMYSNTVSDLQATIIMDRSRFDKFERVIEHLVEFIVANHTDLMTDLRKIVRTFIHFMYFNCDIGRTK